MEELVVTLRLGDKCRDYALPAKVQLAELYPRLLVALRQDYMETGSFTEIILERNGAGMLDQTATLVDYGVCNGSILTVVGKERYHGIR